MAMAPASARRPSGRAVVLALGTAVAAAAALVVGALLLRDDGNAPPLTPSVRLDDIPQQGAVLGDPAAKVTLIEYADLQCPYCRQYSEAVFPAIVNEYVRPGRVKTEFRGLAFLGPDSEKALRFVLAAGMQNRLWQLEEAFYRRQGDENTGWVTDDLARELAGDIPGLDVERLFRDAESADVSAMIARDADRAQRDQVPGIPLFFIKIGDEEPYRLAIGPDPALFRPALDDALAG